MSIRQGSTIVFATAVVLTGAALGLAMSTPSVTNAANNGTNCTAYTDGPHLNPFPVSFNGEDCTDYPLVSTRKTSGGSYPRSMHELNAGLTLTANEEATVRIYVHNGAVDSQRTIAENVQVRIQTDTSRGPNHAISVRAWANNATAITGTTTIHTGYRQALEIVPGSLKILDKRLLDRGSQPIDADTTVNLGNQKGCYEYLRYITFRVKAVPPADQEISEPSPTPTPAPTAQLTAYCNLGSETPAGYESRTLVKFRKGINNPSDFWMSSKSSADRRTQETVNEPLAAGTYRVILGSFDNHSDHGGQGQTREQYYLELKDSSGNMLARTGDSEDIPNNRDYQKSTVNTALVLGSGVVKIAPAHSAYQDTSSHNSVTAVCAAFDKVSSRPDLEPNLIMSKAVRNITQNTGEAESVAANFSDTVEFIIRVTNSGTGNATNVIVADSLPSRLTYVNGSTTLDGNAFADGITSSNGINIGTIAAGATKIVRLRAMIADASQFSVGTTTLTNTASVRADSIATMNDTASVVVTKPQDNPSLSLTKRASNVTRGYGESSSVNAQPGDTIEFTLRVTNNGSATATNVVVSDSLPSRLTYLNGSTTVDGTSYGDGITSGGINIGTIAAGATKIVRFRVRVADDTQFPVGATTLTNYGYARADGIGQISATADVVVTKNISQLYCTPSYQNANVNQLMYLNAYNGTGNYTWYAAYGNPTSGSGSSFATRFNATGTYMVSVADSANGYATCTVNVGPVTSYVLSIHKTGRNVSKGDTEELNSLQAAPGDTLDFFIRVRNLSSVTVTNVIVRDTLPAGLQYIANTTSLNGSIVADGVIAGGINIGSLAPNQEAVVRFNAMVRNDNYFGSGVTNIVNTGYVRADNTVEISDQLPIVVRVGSILGGPGGVVTGAGDLLGISLAVSAAMALAYLGYGQNGLFRTREFWSIMSTAKAHKDKFNFAS